MSGLRAMAASSVVVLLITGLLPASPALASVSGGDFSGTVRDTLGALLGDVEILAVASVVAVQPAAMAKSDPAGCFVLRGLVPGVYRVAALKEGYGVWVGIVDTRSQQWIDLVLRPASVRPYGAPEPPEDPTWVLRLPQRSIFRDIDPSAPLADSPAAAKSGSTAASLPLSVQVDHVMVLAPGTSGAADSLQGARTRLQLAGMVGERARIRVTGLKESVGERDDSGPKSASREAAAFAVGFSYDTGMEAQLRFNAFYRAGAATWAGGSLPQGPAAQHESQSWGYQSAWQQQLSDVSSLVVQVDFNDQTWTGIDDRLIARAEARGEAGLERPTSLSHRNFGAGGTFQSLAADNHQLQVGFDARVYDSGDDTGPSPGAAPLQVGTPGWSVRLDAQDSWSLTGPVTLVYGLGYRQALTSRDIAAVLPRVGGAWSEGGLALRWMVSYLAVARWDDPAGRSLDAGSRVAAGDPFAIAAPADPFGYEAEVEFPIGRGLSLRGATSYSPLETGGGPAADMSAPQVVPLFVSDGHAAVGQARLAVVHDSPSVRSTVEWGRGHAEGLLSALPDDHGSLRLLTPGRLDYRDGSLQLRVAPTGTDVRVQFRNVAETGSDSIVAPSIAERQMIELRVIQDLLRLRGYGDWRLLMAVRFVDLGNTGAQTAQARPAAVNALDSGVSAGLSVSF